MPSTCNWSYNCRLLRANFAPFLHQKTLCNLHIPQPLISLSRARAYLPTRNILLIIPYGSYIIRGVRGEAYGLQRHHGPGHRRKDHWNT